MSTRTPRASYTSLARDGADLDSDYLGDILGRTVRSAEHRPQDGQTLWRDPETVLAKQISESDGGLREHGDSFRQISDRVKNWS